MTSTGKKLLKDWISFLYSSEYKIYFNLFIPYLGIISPDITDTVSNVGIETYTVLVSWLITINPYMAWYWNNNNDDNDTKI